MNCNSRRGGLTMAIACTASLLLGMGVVTGLGVSGRPGAAAPIYGAREVADMELAVMEATVTVQYWSQQEDKANNMVQMLASQPAQSPRDSIMMNLATSQLHRAAGARLEAGLVLERTKQRLDGMRQINEPLTAQVVR
ncbi:MAG: hypothetical protein KIT68_03425 [Phycisphaeraceae bacterium]|nr:hypothetical protein [Phycisphaeraceae bacterium]